jgi:PKD repeat protein
MPLPSVFRFLKRRPIVRGHGLPRLRRSWLTVEQLEARDLLAAGALPPALTPGDGPLGNATKTPGASSLVADAGPDVTTKEGSTVTFAGSYSGGQGHYSYAWDLGDGTTATGTLTPTHSYAEDGTYTATLTITGRHHVWAQSSLVVTVQEVPPTPTITGAPASLTAAPGTSISLGSSVIDPSPADQAAGFTYAWTVTTNGATVAAGNTAGFSFAPTASGAYVVVLTAADPSGAVGKASATINFTASSSLAISAGPNQTAKEGGTVAFAGSASGGIGPFTYAWDFGDGTTATGTLTPTHTYQDDGTYSATLTVTDAGTKTSVQDTAIITVLNVPPTPTITGAPASLTAPSGTPIALGSTVTDPSSVDTTAGFTYAWSVTANGATVATGTTASFSFAPTASGAYVVTLAAADADGAVGTATATINFTAATSLLVVHAGPNQTANEGSAVAFAGSASGGTGPFTYAWNFGDGITATGTLTPTHTYQDNGSYTATLTVTGATGGPVQSSALITVLAMSPTPAITGAPASGQSPAGAPLALGSTVSEPSPTDAAAGFSYAWTASSNGATVATGTTASFTFTPTAVGTYAITLTVTDEDGAVGTTSTTLTVTPVSANTNPILLPPSVLASLRQEAAANTPQWQAFRARLDANLPVVIGPGEYQGSELPWIADYALGYQVLQQSDPATAANYADKALGLMLSALEDTQKGGTVALQFLARGDGRTTSFTLPNADLIPSSLGVDLVTIQTQAITRSTSGNQDQVAYYTQFLKVSNTPDGPADYIQGVDWAHDPNLPNNVIEWLPGGRSPAPGQTYYISTASSLNDSSFVGSGGYRLSGNVLTFNTAPTAGQAIFVEYVYGTHSANGSTLAYQQTHDGTGGFNSIYIDTTYPSRYLGRYVALGLSWLQGYVGLSPALQSRAINLLVRWSDYVRDYGYYNTSPASNYGAGGYVSRVFTALALQGIDPTDGPRLLSEVLAYRQNYVLPLLQNPTTSLKGGFWAEGWNYGPLAAEGILLSGLALEDAGQIPQATAERQWASEVITDLISASPTAGTVFDGGDWYAYPSPFPSNEFVAVLSSLASDPAARSYANYILQNGGGWNSGDTLDLLYRNPSAPAAFWSALPLQDLATGTGLLTARSDWGTTPTWLAFQMGNLLGADHQDAMPGQLQLQRGGDDLLVNANAVGGNQSYKNRYGNTMIIDDGGAGLQTYRYAPGYWYGNPGVTVTAYEAASNYVYMGGDYTAAYNSPSWSTPVTNPATQLTRQVVYLRPDLVIVYDRATTVQASFTKRLQWNFLNTPTVSGNAFVETVGQSRLFGQTFSTVPLTTTVTPVSVGGATVQEVWTQNASPTASVQYVTAFQVASATTAAMVSTQQVVSSDGRMQGVQAGNQVVLFGVHGAVSPTAPVTYQVNGSGSLSHLLVDLQAGQHYQVTANGGLVATLTASAQGTLSFTTTAAGSQTITVTAVQ